MAASLRYVGWIDPFTMKLNEGVSVPSPQYRILYTRTTGKCMCWTETNKVYLHIHWVQNTSTYVDVYTQMGPGFQWWMICDPLFLTLCLPQTCNNILLQCINACTVRFMYCLCCNIYIAELHAPAITCMSLSQFTSNEAYIHNTSVWIFVNVTVYILHIIVLINVRMYCSSRQHNITLCRSHLDVGSLIDIDHLRVSARNGHGASSPHAPEGRQGNRYTQMWHKWLGEHVE